MFKVFFTIISILFSTTIFAQNPIVVSGIVRSEDGKVLPKANVALYQIGFKDTLRTTTNSKGEYSFDKVKPTKTNITITYIGYKKFSDEFDYTGELDEKANYDIVLTSGNFLETVTLSASKVLIKEDTVSFKVDSTMFRKNDNVEEVIKKLPGVEVDKDGKITAQGKEVTKVKVNGKEFFGGDVTTATRQLNADMVDRIQIIDDYGDQAAFTGVKSGEATKTLNIQLKKDKNKGVFGNASAGIGTESRYSSALTLNKFNDEQQISLTGGINNINNSGFDFSRLPGGMGAMAGSTMRSFGVGSGASNGIALSKNIGINYRDQWSKKVSVNGSYSFATKNNNTINDQFLEFPNSKFIDSTLFTKQNSTSNNITDNHRFDFTLDYTIDSFNYIKFQPAFSYREVFDDYKLFSNSFYKTNDLSNTAKNSDINNSSSPNFTGNLLFNHRFRRKGRSLSVNLSGANNTTDGLDVINNTADNYEAGVFNSTRNILQDVIQDNSSYNYGVTASFNEPLSKTKALEFNYSYNKRFVENDKETFNTAVNPSVLVPFQTNIFDNEYTTNRLGVNYRTNFKKYNYSLGLSVQPATIESNTYTGTKIKFKQNIVNYFPVVRFAYNFSKSKSLSFNYNGNTNQPSFQQSQPVPDFSNPQNIIIGNPDLRPEFSNTLSARYNNFNVISGNVFFSSVNFTFTKDKIVNNIINTKFGARETRYLNTDGYYNAVAFYAISKPMQNRKYVFNTGGTITFSNYNSFLDNIKNNGTNWILSQRFAMEYKLKQWLETSGGVVFGLNDVKNSVISASNNSIKTWGITHSSRMFFKHDFNFSYDLTKTINQGFTSNVVANPLIINATLEKMFLKAKNASVKLQGYDLLNQNTNVSRSVSPTNATITDTRTNRLQRYFLLSFSYRFNKFKGTNSTGPGMRTEVRGPGGRMGF